MFNRKIIKHLEQWKNKKNRKPLVLRGARQVGKTSAVKIFAKDNFEIFININLEKSEHFEIFKNVKTIDEFKKNIEIVFKQRIISGKTLIFIDEIQNIPNLIKLLRFFYEDIPNIHIIVAGSLLEVMIEKEGLTMPVGRVEYAYMYPLTFFEYLEAIEEDDLLDFLEKVSFLEKIPDGIHQRAQALFKNYSLLGGMPEIISLHIQNQDQNSLNATYSALLTGYKEDIYKYSSQAEIKYISHILEQSPYFAGERITYEKFGGSIYKSREINLAFQTLEKALIVSQIGSTKSNQMPLVERKKASKKLLFLDVGLVNYRNNIQSDFLRVDDLNDIYRGKIAEQIVGQNILARKTIDTQQLFYWAKEKPKGTAEVDFCLAENGSIIGIEVKSGNSKKLKSLFSFSRNVKNSELVRVYSGILKNENISYASQKYKLLSLPFYLINRI